jgi:HK97 family phage major capsid protein
MTLGNNLSGDGVATYNQRQGLVPAQKINMRDLIPTAVSPTGLYVTYRETGGEGSIGIQTEGNPKSQIDYDLTEVKVVSDYIAGFARFSKQMMFQLPFLQNTLQRMLLRDFYKKENSTFFSAVSLAATGSTTTAATVDAEQLVDWIANQLDANFEASFALVSYAQWADLLKTKPTDYSVPGGFVIDANGNVRIAGVPVIGASWVTNDKALIIDANYLERVETEGLRVEFSYEDSDNFQRNLVTARVECFEDINIMRTDAIIYGSF